MTRKGTILSKITVEQEPGLTDTLVTAELDNTHTAPTFAELGVREEIVRALDERGIERTFAIQELTLPLALAGEDLIGQARTGMGKTFGFGVPLLHRVATADSGTTPLDGTPRALVIVPTRELCIQVTEDLERAGKYLRNHKGALKVSAIYGGRPYDSQIAALRDGVDVVVGTPGRLLDLAKQNHLILGKIGVLVLDEADEMLDLGFLPDIERILTMVPAQRQTMLFSATMPGPIITLARTFLTRPTHIRAEEPHDSAVHDRTAQFVYRAHALDKAELVARVLQAEGRGATMIFTRTKRTAQKVADDLAERGFAVGAVHGDLNQVQREKALDKFRKGAIDVLVATDVAARGIDIDDVTHVINYQCPEDEKTYVHRIGRTGRAGRTGVAVTLIDWDELNRWAGIDTALGLGIPEPVETYSRSPHLFAELGIPEGVTGTVRKAPRVREADAVVEERPARAPRKRNRRRTLRGKPLDESQTTEHSETPAGDAAERVSADAAVADTSAPETPTGNDRVGADEAPARRRRRRRRGGSSANSAGAQAGSADANVAAPTDAATRADAAPQPDAVTQRGAAEPRDSSASDGAATCADTTASEAETANTAAAQVDSAGQSVDAAAATAAVPDAGTTATQNSAAATDSASVPAADAPRRRTRRRTGATEPADTAATDTTVTAAPTAPTSAERESAQDTDVAQVPAEPVERTAPAATEVSTADGQPAPRRRTRKAATGEAATSENTGATVQPAEAAEAPEAATAEAAEGDKPAPRKRATRRTAEAATTETTNGDTPAPRKRATRKKATAEADASAAPTATAAAATSAGPDTTPADPVAQPAEATHAPTGIDSAQANGATGAAPRRRARKAATTETATTEAATTASIGAATAEPAEAATAGAAEGDKPAPRKRATRRTAEAATTETTDGDTPAPRKRATRKKATAEADASAAPTATAAAATSAGPDTTPADPVAQPAEATHAPTGIDSAQANGATGAAPRRRARKATETDGATGEAAEADKPAPRKRAPRKKADSSADAVETTAGSAASA